MVESSSYRVRRAICVTIAAIVIQWLMVTSYVWPASSAAPRDVPVAVSGPAASVNVLVGQINLAQPGAFRFVTVPDAAVARQEVTNRVAYGAIVIPAAGRSPQVFTATAASPAIAQALTAIADRLDGAPTPVRDLAPLSPHDPGGTAASSAMLPLLITSILAGILLDLVIGSVPVRLAALAGVSVGGGALSALVTHNWLGVTVASYAIVAVMFGLLVLAVSSCVAGLGAIAARFGGRRRMPAGFALGAAIFMVLGNPFSGASSAPEMIPGAWGAFGQWLPPGAAVTLLRAVEYFDGHRSGGAWAVLSIWACIGLGLTAASTLGTRTPVFHLQRTTAPNGAGTPAHPAHYGPV